MDTPDLQGTPHGPHGQDEAANSDGGSNPTPPAFGSLIGRGDAAADDAVDADDGVDVPAGRMEIDSPVHPTVAEQGQANANAVAEAPQANANAAGAVVTGGAATAVTASTAGNDLAAMVIAALQGPIQAMGQQLATQFSNAVHGAFAGMRELLQTRTHATAADAAMRTPVQPQPLHVLQQNAVQAAQGVAVTQNTPLLTPAAATAANNMIVAVPPARGAGTKSGLPRLFIDDAIIELARSDPNELRAFMGRLKVYIIAEHGTGRMGYPGLLGFYIKLGRRVNELKLSSWVTGQLHAVALKDPDFAAFEHEAFVEDMLAYLTGEVRSVESVAREKLLAGALVQGTHPYERVAAYAERFQTMARVLPNESGPTLCYFFVRGLHAELQPYCRLDERQEEWSNLHALIRYSSRMEQRWMPERVRSAQKAENAAAAAQMNKRPKHSAGQTPGNGVAAAAVAPPRADAQRKGSKQGAGTSGAAAQLEQGGGKGQYANMDPRSVVSCNPDIKYTRDLQFYRTVADPRACGAFNFKGALKEHPEVKRELALFGLCFVCRQARHQADDCPQKKEPK